MCAEVHDDGCDVNEAATLRRIDINEAMGVLMAGGVVAYPTETVYGLGANAYSDKAVSAVFSCKGRTESNPVSVAYPTFDAAYDDVEVNDLALCIATHFLPGPVTIILRRKPTSKISLLCSAGTDTVGIRVPAHPVALDLLKHLPFPLTASSANKSGKASCTTSDMVAKDLKEVLVLDGGKCPLRIASTVVDCSISFSGAANFIKNLIIRRQGVISVNEILEKL